MAEPATATPVVDGTNTAAESTKTPAPVAGVKPDANANGTAAKTPVPEKMYKVKINGKEEDWPESKVIERAQKSEAAEQMFKRAAGMEKAFTNFVSMAKTPEGALKLLQNPALGTDVKGVVMQAVKSNPELLAEVKQLLIRQEVIPNLPEEQRLPLQQQAELEDLRAFKKAQEAAEQARLKQAQDAARQQNVAKSLAVVGQQIAEALKSSGLPDSKQLGARVARVLLLNRQNNIAMTPQQAVEQVKNDLRAEYHSQFSNVADDEALLGLLPEGVAERVNKALLAKLKAKSETKSEKEKNKAASVNKDKEWVRNLGRGKLL